MDVAGIENGVTVTAPSEEDEHPGVADHSRWSYSVVS